MKARKRSFYRTKAGAETIQDYILSAFTNSRDRNLAKANPFIKGFFNKPLSAANVKLISSEIEDKSIPETLS